MQKYANKDAADEAGAESEDEDEMSSVASFDDDDDEPATTNVQIEGLAEDKLAHSDLSDQDDD